jgi:hypothetical protein
MNAPQISAARKAAIMVAFSEGKVVECRRVGSSSSTWGTTSTPSWDWITYEYRVAPPEPRTLWAISRSDGTIIGTKDNETDAEVEVAFFDKFYISQGPYSYKQFKEVM